MRGGLALTAGLLIAAAAGLSGWVLESHGGDRVPGPKSAVASSSTPVPRVYADCSGPQPTAAVAQRDPSSIIVTCADDGWSFENLEWATWAPTSATGAGIMRVNLCTPDCAAGKIAYYPADVTLSRVADTVAGRVFTQATASFPDGGGPARYPTGQVITEFTLWYPGR